MVLLKTHLTVMISLRKEVQQQVETECKNIVVVDWLPYATLKNVCLRVWERSIALGDAVCSLIVQGGLQLVYNYN